MNDELTAQKLSPSWEAVNIELSFLARSACMHFILILIGTFYLYALDPHTDFHGAKPYS